MSFLIRILCGLRKEKRKAKKAIRGFQEFEAEMKEKIQKEENEDDDGNEDENAKEEEAKHLSKKERLCKCCKRTKHWICCICGLVKSGQLIPTNKR
jgi:hypothetical protein